MRIKDHFHQTEVFLAAVNRGCPTYARLRVLDLHGLTDAWLRGKEDRWARKDSGNHLQMDLPSTRLLAGKEIFTSGAISKMPDSPDSIIAPHPTFLAPSVRRDYGSGWGSTAVMPGMGGPGTGEDRFTLLHEAGHFLQNEGGLYVSDPADLRDHRAECRSDGFAVAWAVALGQNPKDCVNDVGLYRAAQMAPFVVPIYYTLPVLDAAAEVGIQHRKNPDPWKVMEHLDKVTTPLMLDGATIEALQGQRFDGIQDKSRGDEVKGSVNRFLNHQRPWTDRDEQLWWSRLCAMNPEHAPMLRRAPGAAAIAQAAHVMEHHPQRAWSPDARWIGDRLKMAALAGSDGMGSGGSVRWNTIQRVQPRDGRGASHARSLEDMQSVFVEPHDRVICNTLRKLASLARKMDMVPCVTLSPRVRPGLGAPPRSIVLLDMREETFRHDEMRVLADRIRGGGVEKIQVIAGNTATAEEEGWKLRRMADAQRLPVEAIAVETLNDVRTKIKASIARGEMRVIGGGEGLMSSATR